MADWLADARDWCRGRWWQWRLPLLVYLAWIGWHHLTDPLYSSLFSGITLGVHEAGHLLFSWFGHLLEVAGGSIAQVAAPVAAAVVLARQPDYFGVAVCGAWLSCSLSNLAAYIGDARAQVLPLVGFVAHPEHDWHELLSRAGLLTHDTTLAALTRGISALVLAASLTFGVWLCVMMIVERADGAPGER